MHIRNIHASLQIKRGSLDLKGGGATAILVDETGGGLGQPGFLWGGTSYELMRRPIDPPSVRPVWHSEHLSLVNFNVVHPPERHTSPTFRELFCKAQAFSFRGAFFRSAFLAVCCRTRTKENWVRLLNVVNPDEAL